MKIKKAFGRIMIFSGLLALLDQLGKYYAITNLSFTKNTGIAFGIQIPFPLLILSNLLLLFIIIYIAKKELNLNNKITQISLALIIGGGLGNLIDRFTNGYVVDFISIWIWPDFNLADIFITLGVLLILIFYGKIKRQI